MTKFKVAFASAAALGLSLVLSGAASAMPIGNMGSDVNAVAADNSVQNVRWICGPYGCVWRPSYGYGYYAPRYYGGYGYYGRPRYYGYGYGRPWRRW